MNVNDIGKASTWERFTYSLRLFQNLNAEKFEIFTKA